MFIPGRKQNSLIMLKPTKHTLKKLEALFEFLGYNIRYERGNFQSGYCIVQDKKVAVINRFFDTPGRVDCLIDILQNIIVEKDQITDPKMLKFYKEAQKSFTSKEKE